MVRAVRVLAVIAALVCSGCTEKPPILLLTVDTLRADHLAAYGYPRAITPTISRIAADAVVFDRAFTTLPKTTPAYASLLTGQYPYRHGLRALGQELADENRSVAEALAEAGYDTAAFVSSTVMIGRLSNLGQGFRMWDDRMPSRETGRDNYERKAGDTVDSVLGGLDQGFEPGLLFVHLIDPHGPYRAPTPLPVDQRLPRRTRLASVSVPSFQRLPGATTLEEYVDAYDAEVAYADRELGRLLDRLIADGLYDRSLVIVAADHGESLGDDGHFFRHGKTLDESSTRVPLIVKPPGGRRHGAPTRWGGAVSLIDVAPTIADYAGVDLPGEVDGRSLRPIIDGGDGDTDRIVFSERLVGESTQWGAHGRGATLRTDGCFDRLGVAQEACKAVFSPHADRPSEDARQALDAALRAFVARAGAFHLPFAVTWRYHPGDKDFVRRFVRWNNMRWRRYRDDELESLQSLGYVD